MADRVDLLRAQFAEAFDGVRARLEGLSDDEFFWEPVPGCWSIRRVEDAGESSAEAAASRCGWYAEHGFDGKTFRVPDPPPVTTIAWKLVHMGSCNVMYHDHAFGEGRDLWGELVPHTANDAIDLWTRGHGLLSEELDRLTEESIDRPVLTNWGEQWAAWRVFWAMTEHDLHHGHEIACLRDLYAHSR